MPPPVLVLSGSSEFRRTLRMVVEVGPISPIVGPVMIARSWPELNGLVRRHPASPAVVDAAFPGDSDSRPPFASTLRLAAGNPFGVVGRAVLEGIDPARPRRLLARLRKHSAPEASRIMEHVLARSFGPCPVPELAASLGLSNWALLRRCAALSIPTPKKLTDLGRVYTVERLAEWSERPSGVAASAVGFLESANYRRTVRRTLGAPPTVVRQRGGAAYVDQVIARTLASPTDASPTERNSIANN